MTHRPTFSIVIRALSRPGDRDDPGAWRRLRATVKVLLRSFGWKVVSYSTVADTSTAETGTTEGNE